MIAKCFFCAACHLHEEIEHAFYKQQIGQNQAETEQRKKERLFMTRFIAL